MGGGNSKLNAEEGVVVPVKIRPLLLRRFEEFRKRRNGGTRKVEGTLSQQQLLKDSPEEEEGISHENETETQDKDNEKEKEQVKEEIMAVGIISIEKISRVVPLPNIECKCKCKCEEQENEEEKDTNTEQDNQETVFHVDAVAEAHEEEKTTEKNEQEVDAKTDDEKSDDEEDDDDNESEECGRLIYPGSPSFRIYCIETENKEEEEEEEEESKNESIVVLKKSASADSIHSTASRTSRNSNEVTQTVEIEPTRKRKGNKMKKFGAVRTLLKVKSCYYPMSSCNGDNKSRQLVAKMN